VDQQYHYYTRGWTMKTKTTGQVSRFAKGQICLLIAIMVFMAMIPITGSHNLNIAMIAAALLSVTVVVRN